MNNDALTIQFLQLFCTVQIHENNYRKILAEIKSYNAELVAVSKLQTVSAIKELYDLGHRNFGENYVQECLDKYSKLPDDINWHFIGHLQSKKVKQIIPFISMIHGVDSLKLLKEINKYSSKENKRQPVLIQIHIAREDTKFGFSYKEVRELFSSSEIISLGNIELNGFMAMASFTDNVEQIRREFKGLRTFYDEVKREYPHIGAGMKYLSMGMTSDYKIALEEGSNLIRIGSAIFGERKNSPS